MTFSLSVMDGLGEQNVSSCHALRRLEKSGCRELKIFFQSNANTDEWTI